ncbi:Transmembrane protein, partial [Globisporangium splendens]
MLRHIGLHARRALPKTTTAAVVATECQAAQALARRSANPRTFVTTRARLNAEKPAAEGAQAGKPQDALVLTPYEKVTATATGGFWLGLLGLGAAGVYFVIRELMPNRMSPNGLFSETLDFLSENTDVTSRLGMPVHGYGHDHGGHREGRRNRIEHVNLKDKDGNPRLRYVGVHVMPYDIKFNIKGPSGHAYVFAEVNHDMKKHEFVYLIVQFTKTGEVVKVIDNRQILLADTKEEQDALRQLLGKQ